MQQSDADLFDPSWFEVRPSPIAGVGVFATRPHREGEHLLIIHGEVIDEDECDRREVEENNCVIYYLDDNRYIDPTTSLHCRSLNHSCQPNAVPTTRDDRSLWLVALRAIAPGEEVTFDYQYPEIYDLCQEVSAVCLRRQCPILQRLAAAAKSDGETG